MILIQLYCVVYDYYRTLACVRVDRFIYELSAVDMR